ncbi:helix-turn-helix domain-containing protein [Streptomyces sp. ISL-43]|uniref:helix-turn-helix domain-containing protein n=1 Tax=Streptomyces sp. ISL-43 TaxID=2819183 RepID=UPI001BECBC71|nr:helix-turn-helix domain-containing protein [Streptomyces sp. ISL-43]MBT2453106.1 helix-turn-helix domain-containing protein [Streptomyces sp. ISL-43]
MASAERFEWFCDEVSSHVMPVSLSTSHPSDFHADVADLELGSVRLSALTFSPVLSRRTPAHVRRGDPEQFQLALVTRGAFRVAQRSHESLVAGDMVLTDTSRPSEGASIDGQSTVAILQVPRSILPLRHDKVEGLLGQRIRGDRGTGAILGGFLSTLVAQGPSCQPTELVSVGSVALELATACLAQQLGTPDAAPAEVRAQEMLQRVTRFIENNLGNPDLTPQAIADRHNISLRSLYSLFSDQPVSVAAYIRQGRLERARAELGRPESGGHPVQTIAVRWGFSSATAFSRMFRDVYGMTPSEYRAAVPRCEVARSVEESCTPRTARTTGRA